MTKGIRTKTRVLYMAACSKEMSLFLNCYGLNIPALQHLSLVFTSIVTKGHVSDLLEM